MNKPENKEIEIERKFLVKELPKDFKRYPVKVICQGYRDSLRVRAEYDPATLDWACLITIKTGSGKIRRRFGTEITDSQFKQLWPAVEKKISKVRYFLPFRNETVELDCFYEELEGHVLAEVEFDFVQECDAFIPPKWFGREVTDDKRYTNHSLAMYGWPED